ncbi:MAG: DUF1684 domain-containing protein [Flavobacteriaceae bacterium]|nr:DUF1684 domain-containing protein [Flavobacteriaceae bacterium]
MKKALLLLIFLSSVSLTAQDTYIKEIKNYQYKENLKFNDKNTSPLTAKDLRKFSALSFYKIDRKYKIVAKLVKEKNPVIFAMPTTTERKPLYIKYGTLFFTLDGKQQQLNIYQNKDLGRNPMYRDYLFLPFTDKTSGNGSYGGGRYIDVLTTDEKTDGTINIDFNKAYNPYCAYSDRYSCPITPKENHISVEVKAGVKAYK